MASKELGLKKRQLADPDGGIKQRVRNRFALSSDISRDDGFASGVGKFDRAAVSRLEIGGLNLAAIDQGENQTIGDKRPKFLDQIKRQARSAGTIDVKEADVGIKSGGGESGDAIGRHQRIDK